VGNGSPIHTSEAINCGQSGKRRAAYCRRWRRCRGVNRQRKAPRRHSGWVAPGPFARPVRQKPARLRRRERQRHESGYPRACQAARLNCLFEEQRTRLESTLLRAGRCRKQPESHAASERAAEHIAGADKRLMVGSAAEPPRAFRKPCVSDARRTSCRLLLSDRSLAAQAVCATPREAGQGLGNMASNRRAVRIGGGPGPACVRSVVMFPVGRAWLPPLSTECRNDNHQALAGLTSA